MPEDENKAIEFNGVSYTEASLNAMSDDKLLELRNIVASNLGVSRANSFKNHEQAVKNTLAALTKWDSSQSEEAGDGDGETKAKKPKKKKDDGPSGDEKKRLRETKAKSAQIPKRPTRRMFSTIKKLRDPEQGKDRAFAWPDYKDGARLIDIMEDPALHADKVRWWASQKPPYMKLVEPTDEEYETARAAWYKKHGLEDPDEAKAAKKKAAEEAKAKKAAEKAEAKKKADAEKQAKAAEKAKATEPK